MFLGSDARLLRSDSILLGFRAQLSVLRLGICTCVKKMNQSFGFGLSFDKKINKRKTIFCSSLFCLVCFVLFCLTYMHNINLS